MKILLISPPWKRFFNSEHATPPLSINSIAAYLAKNSPEHFIDVLNCDYAGAKTKNVYNFDYTKGYDNYYHRLNDMDDPIWKEIQYKIEGFSPDVIGITAMTASYVSAINVAEISKRINPNIKIVMGGPHVSALPEDTLMQKCVDAVVIGEGELVFHQYIQSGADPFGISGMGYRDKNEKIIINEGHQIIHKLDDLPIPLFESRITKYEKLSDESWTIVGARGCPFRCYFCFDGQEKVRNRSIDHIIHEIEEVKKRYNISSFNFGDDVFSTSKKRIIEFCNKLKESNLNIRWTCNNRVDTIDDEILRIMRDAHCYALRFGIETGSTRTMKLINKGIDLAKCEDSIRKAKKYGFIVSGFFIIGFQWEDESDMKKTIDFMSSIGLDDFQLNIATPLPGTKMFKDLEKQGKIIVSQMDWAKLYQGSLHMNYSDKFSDAEWSKLIMKYVTIANRRIITNQYKLFIKKLLKNPSLIKKIISINGVLKYLYPVFQHSGNIFINRFGFTNYKSRKQRQ